MPVVLTMKDRSTEYGGDHVRHNPQEKGAIPDGVIRPVHDPTVKKGEHSGKRGT
jgi:hypothetical protein